MTTYLAHINVMLRPLVNDPQGLAVKDGLHALGFQHVATVRVGKRVEVTLEAASHTSAEEQVAQMCQRLLANGVIEDYEFTVSEVAKA
jgi:phosphoribosylformylglycinamidine synthase PurS subunit